MTVLDEGLARVGVSLTNASLDLGTDARGWGYGGTAKRSHARSFEDYGEAYSKGDVIGCAVDLADRTLRFAKNGTWFAPPIAMGDALPRDDETNNTLLLHPAVALKNAHARLAVEPPWAFAPPAGFSAVAALAVAPSSSQKGSSQQPQSSRHNTTRSVSAIVVEPARDLAEQTATWFEHYAQFVRDPPVETRLLIGGCDCRAAERDCERGAVDVVVGTPLKLLDRVKRGKLDVSATRFFVLDEADRYCQGGDDLDVVLELFRRLPARDTGVRRLQVAFFSATLHTPEVRRFSDLVCDQPTWVDLKGPSFLPETVTHVVVRVDPANEALRRLVASEHNTVGPRTDGVHRGGDLDARTPSSLNAKDEASEFVKRVKPLVLVRLIEALPTVEQILVFCRTNLDCDHLERYLTALDGSSSVYRPGQKREKGREGRYSCCVLAGGRDMRERRANLDAFKSGDVKILICTDVAARGIDVQGLPLVVNLTLPDTVENYVHRCGRVGRAERVGMAVSIVATVPEYVWYCQKGRKPPQADTRPYAQGGNCVWYDEPALLAAVEARFGGAPSSSDTTQNPGTSNPSPPPPPPPPKTKIHVLEPPGPDEALRLPPELQALAAGAGVDAVGGAAEQPSKRHVQQITRDVDQLKNLETLAQRSFFDFRLIAAAVASSSSPKT
mmetsp:Transcript_11140/g.45125  ORF Transcript_11140/g.45125 Transcript_11140/m.45125 type:complete len:669 (-) Transcript_11140:112-2118(-)